MAESGKATTDADNFGERLEALRVNRLGIPPKRAAINLFGDSDEARHDRKQFANYLLRIERENISVRRHVKARLAKALTFPSVSAFERAIETVFDTPEARNGLPNAAPLQHNPPTPEADRATSALPDALHVDLLEIERVTLGQAEQFAAAVQQITGSATVIADAIDRLSRRLGTSHAADRGPRPKPARRSRSARKRARKTA